MSLDQIRHLADESAKAAAKTKKQPYTPYNAEEISRYGTEVPFPFPNLGSYRPKGWKMVDDLFVDSSGWGSDDEPALTNEQVKRKLVEYLEHGYGYAIIEEGQFQLTLGVFARVTAKSKRS